MSVSLGVPPASLERLLAAEAGGMRHDYLCFWGHRGRSGEVGKSCFSQWYPAPFRVEGEHYPTAEHWMMASKADLFGDRNIRARILADPDPARAKALGRQVAGFDQDVWVRERYARVVAGNLAKFGQHPTLAEFLLHTGTYILVEASPVDPVWGIGLAAEHPDATRPDRWRGLNLLGFALMEVRRRLADTV